LALSPFPRLIAACLSCLSSLLALAAPGALAQGAMRELAQDADPLARGARLAAQICASCHDVGASPGAGAGKGSGAAPSFHAIAGAPGMNERALAVFLRTPHAQMPDIILAPDEIEALAVYVMSRR
jgi:mono/diheme cytochrome c family protein